MNSRERIFAAINHEEPDRIPVDLGATNTTGISAIAYSRLKKYLGIKSGYVRIYDVAQQLAQPENMILDRFSVDAIDVGRIYNTKDEDWYYVNVNGIEAQFPVWFKPKFNEDNSIEVVHTDGTVLARMSEAAKVIDQTYFPCKDKYPKNMNDLLKAMPKMAGFEMITAPMDHLNQKGFWRDFRRRTIDFKKNTDRALCLGAGVSFFQFGTALIPMDKFLIDIMRRPAEVENFLNLVLELQKVSLTMICKYVGDLVDIICIGDDYGENNGLFMNPDLFRELIKPKLKEVCEYIKKNSDMKIFLHCCGSIIPIIPDFIEIGIDILNPVQINARDMEPKFLKENFGDEITFWGGGADTRNVINRKSPKNVKKHVFELLEIFAPGGGYIWNTVHNILPDVPPENILAMFEAIQNYNNEYF